MYFEGAGAAYEGRLLPVCSGHKVPHVGGYGPWFPSEVRLVVDHQLDTKACQLQSEYFDLAAIN